MQRSRHYKTLGVLNLTMFVVYKATSPSGKEYIGITNNFTHRISQHFSQTTKEKTPFGRALKKYKRSVRFEIIDTAETRDEVLVKERHYIAVLNTIKPYGYNSNEGGLGPSFETSERTKVKQSASRKVLYEEYKKTGGTFPRSDIWATPVVCSNGIFYANAHCAAKALKIAVSGVMGCLDGTYDSIKNLRFVYVDKTQIVHPPAGAGWKRPVMCSNGLAYVSARTAERELDLPRGHVLSVCSGRLKPNRGLVFTKIDKTKVAV